MGVDYSFYAKNIETHEHAFLPLNNSAIGTVSLNYFVSHLGEATSKLDFFHRPARKETNVPLHKII